MDTPSPDSVSPPTPTPEDLRRQRVILGRLAAFGRFAFPIRERRSARHAMSWREVGPHASTRECERRARQAARKADKDARRMAPIPVLTSAAARRLKKGDVIQFATVYAINPDPSDG